MKMKNRMRFILFAFLFGICSGIITFASAGQPALLADLACTEVKAEAIDSENEFVNQMLKAAKENQERLSLDVATGEDSWTVAVYMCGSDLERNLGSGTRDLYEMLGANIPKM